MNTSAGIIAGIALLSVLKKAKTGGASIERRFSSVNKLREALQDERLREGITGINMSDVRLNEFPMEILDFPNLKGINLNSCRLSKIPTEISKLKHLKMLKLSYNQFTEFPAEVLSCPSLKTVNLIGNEITSIPERLSPQIKSVDLQENPIGGLSVESVRKLGSRIESLKLFNLFRNIDWNVFSITKDELIYAADMGLDPSQGAYIAKQKGWVENSFDTILSLSENRFSAARYYANDRIKASLISYIRILDMPSGSELVFPDFIDKFKNVKNIYINIDAPYGRAQDLTLKASSIPHLPKLKDISMLGVKNFNLDSVDSISGIESLTIKQLYQFSNSRNLRHLKELSRLHISTTDDALEYVLPEGLSRNLESLLFSGYALRRLPDDFANIKLDYLNIQFSSKLEYSSYQLAKWIREGIDPDILKSIMRKAKLIDREISVRRF